MKMKLHLIILSILAAALTSHAGPISKGGFVISKPGKYFLTKSIDALNPPGYSGTVGVVIASNDVELDLAGFSIRHVNSISFGIYLVGGVKQVRVHNGRVQGVSYGILSELNKKVSSCIFERLQFADCTYEGVTIQGQENVIRSCTVTNVTAQHHGIVVRTSTGMFNEVSDCTVSSTLGGSTGINAGGTDGLIVRRCVVARFEEGFHVTNGCKLMDNVTMDCTTAITGNPVLVGVNH